VPATWHWHLDVPCFSFSCKMQLKLRSKKTGGFVKPSRTLAYVARSPRTLLCYFIFFKQNQKHGAVV
jgi:hypothetical protein